MKWFHLLPLGLALFLSTAASAQLPTQPLKEALSQLPDGGASWLKSSGLSLGHSQKIPTLQRLSEATPAADDSVRISPSWAVVYQTLEHWSPSLSSLSVALPRRLWLDRAGPTISLDSAHNAGLLGEGTIVGVVDTGADASHPSLRNPDGSTRIEWMLVFDRQPLLLHPALEEAYGCLGDDPCAVLHRDDIDAMLEDPVLSGLPRDRIGHGTHIASLAAGNSPGYLGVAPASDLICVAAATDNGSATDSRILIGTRFVFERAGALNKPAVVNVSLGSSFGAHDGSSPIEAALAELAEGPGRAVVIAAGNSGDLYQARSANYPGPLGIHAEYSVPKGTDVRVPLLSLGSPNQPSRTGGLFVWLSTFLDDDLRIAFSNGKDATTRFISAGSSGGISSQEWADADDFDVVIIHGQSDLLPEESQAGSIIVIVAGTWQADRTFELILKGHGTARLWVSATGEFSAQSSGLGPLLPRARSLGTVAIPGSHPDLITVGATHNRDSWTDYLGNNISLTSSAAGRASFSAVGPNQLGSLKPELVAPGSRVIGAMAAASDPRTALGQFSQFSSSGLCPDSSECFVVDDEHGIASGTSMAAPLVAGTAALLFQRDPQLTMQQVKSFLMAGVTRLDEGGVGTGELNIIGSLLAQEAAQSDRQGLSPNPPSRQSSWITWADTFVRPAEAPPLQGTLLLRDALDQPAWFEPESLDIKIEGRGYAEWETIGPGVVNVKVYALPESGGGTLKLTGTFENRTLVTYDIPIAKDPQIARLGFGMMGGTCSQKGGPTPYRSGGFFLVLFSLVSLLRRRAPPRPVR